MLCLRDHTSSLSSCRPESLLQTEMSCPAPPTELHLSVICLHQASQTSHLSYLLQIFPSPPIFPLLENSTTSQGVGLEARPSGHSWSFSRSHLVHFKRVEPFSLFIFATLVLFHSHFSPLVIPIISLWFIFHVLKTTNMWYIPSFAFVISVTPILNYCL